MNVFTKQKQTYTYQKQTQLPKGKCMRGGVNQEVGMHIHTQLYKNLKKNEDMPVQI